MRRTRGYPVASQECRCLLLMFSWISNGTPQPEPGNGSMHPWILVVGRSVSDTRTDSTRVQLLEWLGHFRFFLWFWRFGGNPEILERRAVGQHGANQYWVCRCRVTGTREISDRMFVNLIVRVFKTMSCGRFGDRSFRLVLVAWVSVLMNGNYTVGQ